MKTIGLAVAVLLVLTPAAFGFEPMPPIMQTLLEIFPEKNGWFVDEPLGAVPGTPDEAKPFFESFRVIVPDLESLDKAIGRLMANAPKLPIKKITRYDREPGAPGLAGFRGIWCKTEDESQVGFAIVTVNQNRFLLWAKQGYYPSFAVDSINAKVRDQYARDVSRYLAGVDARVPDNERPQAAGRMLPEWMDLFGRGPGQPFWWAPASFDSITASMAEIHSWGFHGVDAIVPTAAMMDTIISSTTDTLWANRGLFLLQTELGKLIGGGYYDVPDEPHAFDRQVFDSLRHGTAYDFVVDRFGRVRICLASDEGHIGKPLSLFFPAAKVLSTGNFSTAALEPETGPASPRIAQVAAYLSPFFWSYPAYVPRDSVAWITEAHLRSLGHFLRVLRDEGLPPHGILIRKFW